MTLWNMWWRKQFSFGCWPPWGWGCVSVEGLAMKNQVQHPEVMISWILLTLTGYVLNWCWGHLQQKQLFLLLLQPSCVCSPGAYITLGVPLYPWAIKEKTREISNAVNLCSAPLEMESCLSILTRSREQSCTYILSWQRLQVLSSPSVDKILGAQCCCLFNYCYYLVCLGQQFKCNWHKGFAKLITRSACNNFCVSLALLGENNPLKTSWKEGLERACWGQGNSKDVVAILMLIFCCVSGAPVSIKDLIHWFQCRISIKCP